MEFHLDIGHLPMFVQVEAAGAAAIRDPKNFILAPSQENGPRILQGFDARARAYAAAEAPG